jgi:hypothetical protein
VTRRKKSAFCRSVVLLQHIRGQRRAPRAARRA